jgi:flagellar hook assembly protein FlgD
LRLRAHVTNHGINTERPALLCWELDWDTFSEPLQLDRNSLNLSKSDSLLITVAMVSARPGTVTIHNAAGEVIRSYFDGVFLPGVTKYTWDGTNRNGERVAPGVYFVSLKAKEIRRTRTIAVTR